MAGLNYLEEALKTKSTERPSQVQGGQPKMSTSIHRTQIAQVYRREEVAEIYRVLPGNIRKDTEGTRVPGRWDKAIASVLWTKASVWRDLGLTPPTERIPGAGDFFVSSRAGQILSCSESALTAAARAGDVPYKKLNGTQYLFASSDLEERLGHPIVLWPVKDDDPAFTAFTPKSPPIVPPSFAEASEQIGERTFKRLMVEAVKEVVGSVRYSDEIVLTVARSISEELQEAMRNAMREEMHSLLRNKKITVELGALTSDYLIENMGKEIRETIGRSLTANAQEVVLSDRDVHRLTEGFDSSLRRMMSTRSFSDLPVVPPTTALRDRVRGTVPVSSNGQKHD